MSANLRVANLAAVAQDAVDMSKFSELVDAAGGNVASAIKTWEASARQTNTLPSRAENLGYLNQLLDMTDDNVGLAKAIRKENPSIDNLRQLAIGFGARDLERLVQLSDTISAGSDGLRTSVAQVDPVGLAKAVRRNLFRAESTAVVQRMVMDDEIPLSSISRTTIQAILEEDTTFDLRRNSVLSRLSTSTTFRNLADDVKPMVEGEFRSLQRVQALSPVPEAIPVLFSQGLTTALQISNIGEGSFVKAYSSQFGDADIAASVHRHATASRIRNEHFLVNALQTVRGSGLRVIDGGSGKANVELRTVTFSDMMSGLTTQVNLEQLFGTLDYCECSDCSSVYSPAAYFVELMEFLRHNNLQPGASNVGNSSLSGTQLERLLLRRPDLQCIQLTCENANTLIPYIDLALEVMESYVVHAPRIMAFNVQGETSSELLCSPQHTNREAYAILRDSVYPLTLPYHHPIDTIRTFLGFLGSSYAELLQVFQADVLQTGNSPSSNHIAAQRAADAEFNLITQEEYVILTHEAFTPPPVSSGSCSQPCGCDQCRPTRSRYNSKIRLRHPWEYFGYKTSTDLLADGDNPKIGLTWVKAQFLPRTGLQYTDLVTLLQTRYVNPNMPMGKPLATMLKIKFSYRFLSFLVRRQFCDHRRRFSWLIRFLSLAQPLIPLLQWAQEINDPCAGISPANGGSQGGGCGCGRATSNLHQSSCFCHCNDECEWRDWVNRWFERVGRVIVLESGEGPRLPIRGQVWAERRYYFSARESDSRILPSTDSQVSPSNTVFIGNLHEDGGIVKGDAPIALVSADGKIIDIQTGKELSETYRNMQLSVYADDPTQTNEAEQVGYVGGKDNTLLYYASGNERFAVPARYSTTQDSCDIEKVRLLHLDGSPVQPKEYERMARLVRLARKMGWSIEETDAAIQGLGVSKSQGVGMDNENPDEERSGCDAPSDEEDDDDDNECDASAAAIATGDITPMLIHQLVAVKRLIDITGLALPALLTFWTDMPTHGDKSLYATTFLTHNLLAVDPVFQADSDGNFLTSGETISAHVPVLSAALRLKAEDISIIRDVRHIADNLTLNNVSELYRISRLLRLLNMTAPYLADVLAIFGDPFTDAETTLEFVETWQRLTESDFTFPQLNYICRGIDNLAFPIAPSQPAILRLTKTIYDGLVDIDKQHPEIFQADIDNNTIALESAIPTFLALVYDPILVSRITGLVFGRYIFTTNAPAGLSLAANLPDKVKYLQQVDRNPPTAQLQVTGIMTDDEMAVVLGLSSNALWAAAVARITKQGITLYNQTLASMLPADGAAVMLEGDTESTATEKGLYLLRFFIPFLRMSLATQLIRTSVADTTGLDIKIVSYLLEVVKAQSGESALDRLLAVKAAGSGDASGWDGFLIPSNNSQYTFIVIQDDQPAPMTINGRPTPFPHQSEDPSNIWSSDPISMIAGTLYAVHLSGLTPQQLSWSTATSPATPVPTSSLLPALSADAVREVLEKIVKLSLLIEGFRLSLDELVYFHHHGSDFPSGPEGTALDLGAMNLGMWKRLLTYSTLRDQLPKQPTRLIDLFSKASLPDTTDLTAEIVKVTLWDSDKVEKLRAGYRAVDAAYFRNESALIQLGKALNIAQKTRIDIDLLFQWAKPLSLSDTAYGKLEATADALKNALRARYNADQWEQAAKPLYDSLRKNQRDALVAYLVVEESLLATGLVKDADSLFEYFLIDCQMSACLETSRIKQAIASIQLYVQRCLLGLEQEVGSQEADLIDRDRWNWMKRYRVWEANRKVYLYPENWIVPSLRDDKSPFFMDLESQLNQKDVSLSNAAESLKEYIYSVAYVSNMKACGLFVVQMEKDDSKYGVNIVARRMNAPFDWYSREYSSQGFWSPWVKMPIDIPNYDVDSADGNSRGSGSYICPVIWQSQPIIFFLQMIQKQIARSTDRSKNMWQSLNSDDSEKSKPRPLWEIRLGYSIYQNGKWSPKQLSEDSLRHRGRLIQIWDPKTTGDSNQSNWKKLNTYPLPDQTAYQMYPRIISEAELRIDVVYRDDLYDELGGETAPFSYRVGTFVFASGGIARKIDNAGGTPVDTVTEFQFTPGNDVLTMYSYQASGYSNAPPFYSQLPRVEYARYPGEGSKSKIFIVGDTSYIFNHTFIDPLLANISASNTTQSLHQLYVHFAALSGKADTNLDDPFGRTANDSFNERLSPYGIYNWELGLHAPMTIIDGLLKAQQFDDALEMCHTIFDPNTVATGTTGTGDNSRYWKFLPFKALANTDAKATLEQMFLQLEPQTPDTEVNEWRENPFSPHAVARGRPVAYMKWVAMKYIEVLLEYGDYFFRQNSLETIPNAIQCYVIASHVYGPRGQKIPPRGKKRPETYASLLNRWDAFGNAIVQLEVDFPFSNQTLLPIGSSNGITGLANIFGFATSLYFCIPDNPKLRELRDRIDDRLYKIRNCMDINGVTRHLALWDPPIDPALLVQATAQGLSLDTVLNDLSGPMPNYRFQILLSKAFEMCSELRQLGTAFLAAKEKKDGEALSVLRASHETVMNNLVLDVRRRQLDEANKSLDQLLHSRQGPSYRLQFFRFLVGNTDAAPGETDEFNEVPNPSLQAPVAEGELLLIKSEQEEIQKALAAQNWALAIGSVEAMAAIFHAIPSSELAAKPWGVGAGLVWGGANLGHTTSAVARGLQVYETYLSRSSANAARKSSLMRQMQDRVYQANVAGLELKNIDRQIATQRVRISTMEQEVLNQEKMLDQVTAIEDFLRTKYTNTELYSWIEGTTKSLYQQSYNMAFDLAKRAEKGFKFERPQNSTEFIRVGYWNNARDGLLAGEQLFLSLKRLEAAYQEDLGHDFELTKHVSIRQWAPLALIDFRETGSFEFQLPEILFDMDCPGHYMRRITSVAVTIPCVVGPYNSVNCTLRLLSHRIRTTPRASGKADYPQSTEGDDDRFSVLNVPISWVTLSSAQNDTGRHELSLNDRYNPFEGAGAISSWRFELPADFRSFDYGTVTDVIMHIRYTSLDGGDKLRQIAAATVADYVKVMEHTSTDGGGLAMFFDVRTDFASEWYAAFSQGDGALPSAREIPMNNLSDRLPLFTRRTQPKRIVATSMVLLGRGPLVADEVELQPQNATEVTRFQPGVNIQDLIGLSSEGLQIPMTNWVLRLKGTSVGVERIWLVVNYALT